jgi:hypothetical protein
MTRRIEFTVADEKAAEYDEDRGLVPLAAWIKAILDQHLQQNAAMRDAPRVDARRT